MEFLLLTALWLFVLTNIDAFVVLLAFCTDERYEALEILIGHSLGFAVGLAIATVGALLAAETLGEYGYLLGIMPVLLGLWGYRREPASDQTRPEGGTTHLGRVSTVAIVGVGLSGENIAVYMPYFMTLTEYELPIVLVLYLLGAGGTFLLVHWISNRSASFNIPTWVEVHLVHLTLIAIGVYVLLTGWLAW